jgi:hypothetical protein
MKMDKKVIIIDPNSEEYFFPYPLKKDKESGNKTNRLDAIFSIKSFPKQVREVFSEYGKEAAWQTLESRKLLLSFVDWYVESCVKYGATIILPPAPLIDGKSTKMIDIVKQINNTTQSVVKARTDCYPASYVPISSDAFFDENSPQRILDMISEIAQLHSIIALKFYRSGKSLNQAITRRRMKDFLMALDALKKINYDNLAIMILDTKAEGVAYFGNGVDLTCDPLGGVKDVVFFGKKKQNVDTGDEVEEQPIELRNYGRIFHHEMREYLTIPEVRSVLGPTGKLTHDCKFCKDLGDGLTKEKDEPGFPKQDQWNAGRRLHNFTCRREEDAKIREEAMSGNAKVVELFLKEEGRGNKNLIDLIP